MSEELRWDDKRGMYDLVDFKCVHLSGKQVGIILHVYRNDNIHKVSKCFQFSIPEDTAIDMKKELESAIPIPMGQFKYGEAPKGMDADQSAP